MLFRNYYRNSFNPPNVPKVNEREFAFQFFESESMVRHRGFSNWGELAKFLVDKAPRHVYMSSAYFKNPQAEDMEAKGWLGADLVFDIDGDHLPTEECKSSELVTLGCLNDALNEARKLVEVLVYEFGVEEKYIRVTFSGHRGFHIHVEGPDEVIRLGQDERRMIVEYLTAKSNVVNQLMVRDRAGRGRLVKVDEADERVLKAYGSLGRLVKALREHNIKASVRGIDKIPQDVFAIHVDEVVTIDVNRLIRMPNSLHGKTGLKVAELTIDELYGDLQKIIEKSIAFKRGSPRVRLTQRIGVREVLGERINVNEPGEEESLPIYVAVYLMAKGLAQLAE